MSSTLGGGSTPANVINREHELALIKRAFKELLASDKLLSTPIIDFFGVDGIGKTSILYAIKEMCQAQGLLCIWIDANQHILQLSHDLIGQVKHRLPLKQMLATEDVYTQSVQATRDLLEREPVVVIVDSIDATNEELLQWIEAMLHDLIEDPHLFVILASKQKLSFDSDRSLGRKLTPFQLRPLDWRSSESYLNTIDNKSLSESESRRFSESKEIIFHWTRGYPLAMNAMAAAIKTGLDPQRAEHQSLLVDIIIKQVIDNSLLTRVELAERDKRKAYLSLLSMPRRFNLVIMQELIDKFDATLKLKSRLKYMGLPKSIDQHIDVLDWDVRQAGYTIDEPIRNLFQLYRRIKDPASFRAIHAFLAQRNAELAAEVSGTDRVRFLKEYLYHSAHSEDPAALAPIVSRTLERIQQEPDDAFVQFEAEFSHDSELQDALGQDNVASIYAFIHHPQAQEGM
ncbi:MAG: hypothetical protein H0W02_03140 [Ktedonobacteraceae bacterium]|nr:hypothetical protein [Ktedonobacteraceae bacterium]